VTFKPRPKKSKVVFIAGPTAVGKTVVAASLARKISAEIITCDSMQIYKGMDILTSKPSAILRKNIPHHLLGTIPPAREYDVSRYRKDALKAMRSIIKKGKVPLFVGGTGLYMSVLLDGIFKTGPIDEKIRQRLLAEAARLGSTHLHAQLKKVDPEAAEIIHPHDTRRIIRALEVYRGTGKPISELKKERRGLVDEFDVQVFCLNLERNKLYGRINRRVEKMFKEGLMDEARRILNRRLSRTASFAIGLKEIRDYLDGRISEKEAKELIKKNTRNYAKRQLTWFRKDKRIIWINIKESDAPKLTGERIWRRLS